MQHHMWTRRYACSVELACVISTMYYWEELINKHEFVCSMCRVFKNDILELCSDLTNSLSPCAGVATRN